MSETPLNQPVLQAYKVNLSKGDAMPCDTDELPQIVLAVKTGSPCKIRSGIFNPSYYVSITEDKDRIEEVEIQNSRIRKCNEQESRYGKAKNYENYKELKPIKDIFEGVNLSTGSQLTNKTEKLVTLQPKPKTKKTKEIGEYRAK